MLLVCSQAARPLNGSTGSSTVNVVSCINIGDQETQEICHKSQQHHKSRWSMSIVVGGRACEQHTYAGLTLPCKPKHTWRIDELHNIRWSDSSTVQAAAFLPADWSMDMIWPPSCHASKSIQKGTFDFNLERHSDIPILYTFLFMYILHIHRNTHTHWSIYYIIYIWLQFISIYIYITYILYI